jgi:hypothetical protein
MNPGMDSKFCNEDSDCGVGYSCGKQIANPYNGFLSFDTYLWAFVQVILFYFIGFFLVYAGRMVRDYDGFVDHG